MGSDVVVFVVGYVAVLAVALLMYRSLGLTFLKPSVPMLVVLLYIVLAYLGTILLYFDVGSVASVRLLSDQSIMFSVWLYTSAALLLLLGGMMFTRFVLRIKEPEEPNPPASEQEAFLPMTRVWAVILVCFVVLVWYIQSIPAVPLLELLAGADEGTIRQLRSDATNAFDPAWRYNLFTISIASFLSYALFVAFINNLKRKEYLVAFLAAAAITSAASSITLVRSAVVTYWASLLFLYYISKRKSVPISCGVSAVVVLGGITTFIFASVARSDFSSAVGGVLTRLMGGGPVGSYLYLEIFPAYHDFLGGASFPNPSGLLPFTQFPLSQFVAYYYTQVFGVVASSPAPFWGEMYVNFGVVGVLIVPFLVGIALWLMHTRLLRMPGTPVTFALVTFLAFYMRRLASSSLSQFFIPVDGIAVLAVFAFLSLRRTRPHPVSEPVTPIAPVQARAELPSPQSGSAELV